MIDERLQQLIKLEEGYLLTRSNKLFDIYYNALIKVGYKVLSQIASSKKLFMTPASKEVIVLDSIHRLCQMYLKYPDYSLTVNIVNRVYNEITFQLFNNKTKRNDKLEDITIHDDLQSVYEPLDFSIFKTRELEDQVIAVARSFCYKKLFYKEISKFLPVDFIYENSTILAQLFEIHRKLENHHE